MLHFNWLENRKWSDFLLNFQKLEKLINQNWSTLFSYKLFRWTRHDSRKQSWQSKDSKFKQYSFLSYFNRLTPWIKKKKKKWWKPFAPTRISYCKNLQEPGFLSDWNIPLSCWNFLLKAESGAVNAPAGVTPAAGTAGNWAPEIYSLIRAGFIERNSVKQCTHRALGCPRAAGRALSWSCHCWESSTCSLPEPWVKLQEAVPGEGPERVGVGVEPSGCRDAPDITPACSYDSFVCVHRSHWALPQHLGYRGELPRSVPSNNQVLLSALVAVPLAGSLQCGVRNGLVNTEDIEVLYKWLVGNRADFMQGGEQSLKNNFARLLETDFFIECLCSFNILALFPPPLRFYLNFCPSWVSFLKAGLN